jgi:outer membrane lipoprotein-sorting protein
MDAEVPRQDTLAKYLERIETRIGVRRRSAEEVERRRKVKRRIGLAAAALTVGLMGLAASAVTADEILDAMDAESDLLVEGGMIVTVQFETAFADGTGNAYLLYSLAAPGKQLMYFAEPALERGTIFLTVEEEVDGKTDSRFFLYLSSLTITKELVTETDQGGSFAGSSLSFSDVGGRDDRQDYDAVILREEAVSVGGLDRTAYILESTAVAGADVDEVRVLMWVDAEILTVLKMEAYNDLGALSSRMTVTSLSEFDGRLTPDVMVAEDLDEGSTTRPEGEIPAVVFDPASLAVFKPADWGFE